MTERWHNDEVIAAQARPKGQNYEKKVNETADMKWSQRRAEKIG